MEQYEIKKLSDDIREKLRLLDKKYKRDRADIIDEWDEIIRKCNHPNIQGKNIGYCPDCGYTFG